MQNQKNANAKKSIPSIKKDAKMENLKEINLSKFSDQLKNVELKEKRKRETIYIYPETFLEKDINSEKGKKFRNGKRNIMKRYCNNILLYAKMNRLEDLKNEIKAFQSNYKDSYKLNDYSINSISNSKDEGKEKDLSLMLNIIKEII